MARRVSILAMLTPTRQARVHEPWVDGEEFLGAKAQPLHHSWTVGLYENISRTCERFQRALPCLSLEVQRHRALAQLQRGRAKMRPSWRAIWLIDTHHIGTKVREQAATKRHGGKAFELNDLDSVEWAAC